jgi:biotin carboxylase
VVARDPGSGSARLLVLGAGPAQLGLLEAARRRGIWTAVADRDPAAPGFRLADRRCILSTEDEPAVERLVSALGVDGIVAPGTDWPVGVAARIAERAGLPHPISAATAQLATNKLRQRERLAAAGVPQPRYAVATIDGIVGDVALPCVVKAADRQGQKGLALVREASELEAKIDEARAESRAGVALVEELVDGPEVTVVGVSVGGEFTALTVTDRLTADPPAFGVALAHVYPSALEDTDGVAAAAGAAVRALGIEAGPSYTQLRVGPDGPQVIEVAARLGGGHDAELVEAAVGVPLNDLTLDAALAAPVDRPRPRSLVGGAVTQFLVAPPGTLAGVEVPSDLERVRIYRGPGFVFGPLRRGADRAGAVLVTADSRAAALAPLSIR